MTASATPENYTTLTDATVGSHCPGAPRHRSTVLSSREERPLFAHTGQLESTTLS